MTDEYQLPRAYHTEREVETLLRETLPAAGLTVCTCPGCFRLREGAMIGLCHTCFQAQMPYQHAHPSEDESV